MGEGCGRLVPGFFKEARDRVVLLRGSSLHKRASLRGLGFMA